MSIAQSPLLVTGSDTGVKSPNSDINASRSAMSTNDMPYSSVPNEPEKQIHSVNSEVSLLKYDSSS